MEDKGHWKETEQTLGDFQSQIGFVYLITNKENNKKYIGKKSMRVKGWKNYCSSCKTLKDEIKKIGQENFDFEILLYCKNKWELAYFEGLGIMLSGQILKEGYYNGGIRLRLGNPPKNLDPTLEGQFRRLLRKFKGGYNERLNPFIRDKD